MNQASRPNHHPAGTDTQLFSSLLDAVGVAADAIGSGLDIMGRGFAPLGIVGPFAKMSKNRRESRLAAELVELWKLAFADPALIEQACRHLTSR